MNFQLVDSGWDRILDEALKADHSSIQIVCPFIKERAARRLLKYGHPDKFQVITRFNPAAFLEGVSDTAALRLCLEAGAQIRGIKNLHAKAYLVGSDRVIVTSANLTEQALVRNHEFGFSAQDAEIVATCHDYFDGLWKRAGKDLTIAQIDVWEGEVASWKSSGKIIPVPSGFKDEGVDLGFSSGVEAAPDRVNSAEQGFLKIFGKGDDREKPSLPVWAEVARAGCHYACCYPKGKKPRQVRDGAMIFMGRLVEDPLDTLIFGRAIGFQYRDGQDDATDSELKERPWKADYPHCVRVTDTEFVDGTLSDGVSLGDLLRELGPNSFASTKRNLNSGRGNTAPTHALMRRAAVELTPEAISRLNERLNNCFKRCGRISQERLDKLDWPRGSRVSR